MPTPGPVTRHRIASVSGGTIVHRWGPPSVGTPTHYEVRLNGGTPASVGLDLENIFSDLDPHTTYTLEVRAVDSGSAPPEGPWGSINGTTAGPPSVGSKVGLRVRAYEPNGDDLGTLPTPMTVAASIPLNELAGMELAYHPRAPLASILGQPLELALEVTSDAGHSWYEPMNGRYLYLGDARDPAQDTAYTITAPGYLKRLEKVVVDPADCTSGQLEFIDATAGAVLDALFDAAVARGAMTGMSWLFTALNDTIGNTWTDTRTIAFAAGQTYLSIVLEMAQSGWIDVVTQGREILVYVPDSPGAAGVIDDVAEDLTITDNPVSFRYGRDMTDGSFRRTWENLADTAVVIGDADAFNTQNNPLEPTPWGRQEVVIPAAGVTDDITLGVIGVHALENANEPRVEYTVGLNFSRAAHLPFRDYNLGNYVRLFLENAGVMAAMKVRIRQITLTLTEGAASGNVVLNDRFLENDVKVSRAVAGLIRGATS